MTLPPEHRRPPALLYHGFAHSRRPDDPENLFVPARSLTEQLDHLLARGWEGLDLDAYLQTLTSNRRSRRAFLFTIDDAYTSVADIAVPLLAQRRIPSVLFVPAGLVGAAAHWLPAPPNEPLLDADTLRAITREGVEIGAHGFDHRSMKGLDEIELHRQTAEVRQRLADLIGRPPRAFAYPFGAFDARARGAVERAGYDIAFSVFHDVGQFAISRVDVNATDTIGSLRLKLLPGYRSIWRAAGRLGPLRRAVRRMAMGGPRRNNGSADARA